MRQIQLPGSIVTSIADNELGHVVIGSVDNIGSGLPTTTLTFGVGCRIVDRSTAIIWKNVGSSITPVWESEQIQITVPVTSAQIIAMYTTPVLVVSPIPGRAIILDSFEFDLTGTATQFTGGGVVDLQYDSTANGAGTTLHADIAATVVTAATARVISLRTPSDLSAIAAASIIGKGVYISNKTAVFATGTGTAMLKVRYHII